MHSSSRRRKRRSRVLILAIGIGAIFLSFSNLIWHRRAASNKADLYAGVVELADPSQPTQSPPFEQTTQTIHQHTPDVSQPAVGDKQTCSRTVADYFANVDYGYDRESLYASQARRDQDLQNVSILDIFDSRVPGNDNPMTHRWAGNFFAHHLILEFAQKVIAPFKNEWSQFPGRKREAKNPKIDYYRRNGMHEGSDPILLHSFLRTFRPQHVLEIGSGFSSRVTAAALARNQNDQCGGPASDFYVMDPALTRMARDGATGKVVGPTRVLHSWLEDQSMSFVLDFLKTPGDLFFIDSSHALGAGGSGVGSFYIDVMVEFAELLPRLQPGVYVHVHDIPFPDHVWFYERNWAEQFVLSALLMNNPYFDILWSGGALNMPWEQLEHPDDPAAPDRVQHTRQAATDAFGGDEHYHVQEVGRKRPFAGGGSIWLRRNPRPYKSTTTTTTTTSTQETTIPANETTTKAFLTNPRRHLIGIAGIMDAAKQQKFLEQVLRSSQSAERQDQCTKGTTRMADCVVCAFLSSPHARGTAHVFDLDRLVASTSCQSSGNDNRKRVSHPRKDMLDLPLSFFTSLQEGDTIVLSNAHWMANKAGNADALASTLFIMEVAPRLPPGVNVILYGAPMRDVSTLVEKQQGEFVGTFLIQAWLTMNDAVEVLWWQDSDSSVHQAAGFTTTTAPALEESDHAIILRIV